MHTQTRHALRGIVSRLLFGLLLLAATAEAHERPLFARSSRGTARRDSSETEPTGKIVMRRASPFLLDLRRCHAIRVMRRANVGRRLSVAGPSATAEATERLLFRRINARHRAKRCDRNGTNGQDRHATSFPLPPGPQEMPLGPQETPRDTRDEAGQRRGRLNSHCTQQSHCIQLSHRRRYRRPTPGEEEERKEAPLPYHRHVEEAKPLAIGEEGEASLSHLEAASVLLPKQTPATGEHEDLLRERRSNVEEAVSRPFFARDLAASSDEMHYPLDDAVGGLQGMPRVTAGEREEDADALLRERRSNVEVAFSRPFFARDLAASSDEMHYPLDDAVGGLQGMPREFFQRLPVAFSR